ncbi:MAG: phage tail protein [Phaeodactylibacter sp.]|nr:phage tail protein [Phaeodactylibacter sp.]
MDDFYLAPPAFFFGLSFGTDGGSLDGSFQEVSGLEVELEVEDVIEGGNNSFKHRLPVRTSYRNLTLKRGLVTEEKYTILTEWVKNNLLSETNLDEPIETRDLTVSLFNAGGEIVMSWNVYGAYPVKWSVSNFNAQESALSIETLELAFREFKVAT